MKTTIVIYNAKDEPLVRAELTQLKTTKWEEALDHSFDWAEARLAHQQKSGSKPVRVELNVFCAEVKKK